MNNSQWFRIEQIFERAIHLPADRRQDFILRVCKNDEELRTEVSSLIKHFECANEKSNITSLKTRNEELNELFESLIEQFQFEFECGTDPGDPIETTETVNSQKFQQEVFFAALEAREPDFIVKSVLCEGGMGTVLKVRQKSLNRDIAVKVLRPSTISPLARRRFFKESESTARIRNDHVVSIYSAKNDELYPYLAMELIEGPTLANAVKHQGHPAPKIAAEIVSQIAFGLESVHGHRLIHRDLKPGNIMLEARQSGQPVNIHDLKTFRVKIIDFGIVREMGVDDDATLEQAIAGTPAYMSPEQLFDPRSVDERTDIWSLGVILYELMTSKRPFAGKSTQEVISKILKGDFLPPCELDNELPCPLETICLNALTLDCKERYQSVASFNEDVESFLNGATVVGKRQSQTSGFLGRYNSWVTLVALCTLIVALVAVPLQLAFWPSSDKPTVSLEKALGSMKDMIVVANHMRHERGMERSGLIAFEELSQRVDELLELAPDSNELKICRVDVDDSLAGLYAEVGDAQKAVPYFTRSIELGKKVPSSQLGGALFEPTFALAANHLLRGEAYHQVGDIKKALVDYAEAIKMLEKIRKGDAPIEPGEAVSSEQLDKHSRFYVARNWILNSVLKAHAYRDLGDSGTATSWYKKAEELSSQLPENCILDSLDGAYSIDLPPTVAVDHIAAFAKHYLARDLLENGFLDEAKVLFEEALQLRKSLAINHPNIVRYVRDYSLTLTEVARLNRTQGDLAAAVLNVNEAVESQVLNEHLSFKLEPKLRLAQSLLLRAELSRQAGSGFASREADLKLAEELLEEVLAASPAWMEARYARIEVYLETARLSGDQNNVEQLTEHLAQASSLAKATVLETDIVWFENILSEIEDFEQRNAK